MKIHHLLQIQNFQILLLIILQIQYFLGLSLDIIIYLLSLVIEIHLPWGLQTFILELIFQHPPGTNIYAICSRNSNLYRISTVQIGYTIIIEYKNLQIIYGHVSPDFIIKPNSKIKEKQKIGTVGQKYIDSKENTKYFDENGKKTNGATTGEHLHLTIKKDGKAVNPLDYL